MQLEIYSLTALKDQISVSLEAICDSYSSLLWDIEFYQCGCFEVYIAASPQNVSTFQRGRIVARSDDAQHFGIIESLQLETPTKKDRRELEDFTAPEFMDDFDFDFDFEE